MHATDVIARKRDGETLTTDEIMWFIEGVTNGAIPDYQVAAWLMAVCIRGCRTGETVDLAMAMAHSGEILDLSGVVDFAVDKHSSGGVGDKTTLVVLPLVVACGVPVGKMSGRGLGFSGGTLDKMESIAGYRSDLSTEAFLSQLKTHGIVLSGQSADLAPADGMLYALRDVTSTVRSTPLIASSIMSKKLAAGANGIVLDVKAGTGAFMGEVSAARTLAELMIGIGRDAGRKMVALISDMNQPLGAAVGNALEVREAIDVLRGGGPADLRDALPHRGRAHAAPGRHSERPGAAGPDAHDGGEAAERRGAGAFPPAGGTSGGDVRMVDDPDRLPQATIVETIAAPARGYVKRVEARAVGIASKVLGAGREKKGDPIDHAVGVVAHCKVGDAVAAGDPLFTVHANDAARLDEAKSRLSRAITLSEAPVAPLPLFYDMLEAI
ncbi:MAG: thymidine phosphorylase [Anaerolineae bacterium]|nr:thymidine phosphorylase [Anaerolineae bacterium]